MFMKKCCSNCMYADEGICSYCEGDNFGYPSEVSDRGVCNNFVRSDTITLILLMVGITANVAFVVLSLLNS